ncbi:MAG: hypothetical protein RML95_12125 [Anaerolineae bacterium]|nr:hypothetical protein [Anaerolineae bacterium]
MPQFCPFCTKQHDFSRFPFSCPETGREVPMTFIREYRSTPPLWLVSVGFSGHGKTVYQSALTLMLEQISAVWEGVYNRYLDPETNRIVREWRHQALTGEQPRPNPAQQLPPPILMSVYNIPTYGSRCVVMYDISGEVFESLDLVNSDPNFIAVLRHVDTVWFLISLKDLLSFDNQQGGMHTMQDLFNAYMTGMEQLGARMQGRNLIVVYTKADAVFFPPEVRAYLAEDELRDLTNPASELILPTAWDMNAYVARMEHISELLLQYTRKNIRGGAAFINIARSHGMNLKFCVTSALGRSPDGETHVMREAATRYRVLDPFIWALHLQREKPTGSYALVLDAGQGADPAYQHNLPRKLFELIHEHGDVTTYFMGEAKPTSLAGQQPPERPPRTARPRLIGPIVDRLAPDTTVVILASGRTRDLADFRQSARRHKLLLVVFDEDDTTEWEHKFIYRTPEDVETLIEVILALNTGRAE